MVKQYPYTLKKLSISNSIQNSKGDFEVVGGETWITICKCRNEDANQRRISVSESNYLTATHLIQCPKGVNSLVSGDKIKVVNEDDSVRLSGIVIYSEKKQLHTQIWL